MLCDTPCGYTMDEQQRESYHMEVTAKQSCTATAGVLDVPKTADEWALYERPNSEEVAAALGAKLDGLLGASLRTGRQDHDEARRVRDIMYAEMDRYEDLGTRDTLTEGVLIDTIERAFGLPDNSVPRFDG